MNGRKPKLSPEDARRVREWASFGTNQSEVARRLGIDRRTVRYYINRVHKRPEYA